jgi:hypothetical protein
MSPPDLSRALGPRSDPVKLSAIAGDLEQSANPNHFLIARSLAPELVGAEDIVELDLDGQTGARRGPAAGP